jgi:hypothetical protein
MVMGFAFDNYGFGRVDHPATQIVLFSYLVFAILSMLALHFIESHPERQGRLQKVHPLLVAATQFALGGLWSAFLIFYGRSAVIAASWPFLLVLAAMLVGNELFQKYRARLAFTSTLLFFALFSYAIFVVPVATGTMGQRTFLISGSLAIIGFVIVLLALLAAGPARIRAAWREIALGAIGVYAGINLFYFISILPPLPLTLAHAGVFHSVTKVGDTYEALAEPQAWYGLAGAAPVLHVGPGEPLYLYSAVFAPIQLRTNIVHIWQRYDEALGRWRTESTVKFPITGGREGGHRGYSIKSSPRAGRWRVDIATPEGLLIGRLRFSVVSGAARSTLQILR